MLMERVELRWGVEQRLAFIETRLFWEGGINRGDLVRTFDISVPQASKDLALYQDRAPANLRYDKTQKRYVATEAFTPCFTAPDADAYLASLSEAPSGLSLSAEHLPLPRRSIDAAVLRLIVAAMRDRSSIEVRYQSMMAGRPAWRRLSPHAFAHDGARWHVRAWCEDKQAFLDFILSRCLAARDPSVTGKVACEDLSWHDEVAVVLAVNPALTPDQQRVVCDDYGMSGGEVVLRVRRALLGYFDMRMRLDVIGQAANPRAASVIVKNRTAYDAALREAEPRPD